MPIISDSEKCPQVLVSDGRPYVARGARSRVCAGGADDGSGGSAPAAAVPPPLFSDEFESTEECWPSDDEVSANLFADFGFHSSVVGPRQLFEERPFASVPARVMTDRQFAAGVSHHWAPLLAGLATRRPLAAQWNCDREV